MKRLRDPVASSERLYHGTAATRSQTRPDAVATSATLEGKCRASRCCSLGSAPRPLRGGTARPRLVLRVRLSCAAAASAAPCLSDFTGHQTEATLTCNSVYLRLHGPGKSPDRASYAPAALEALAGQLIGWVEAGFDAFVYFDNDEAGYAALNARDLLARLDRQRDETAPPKTQGLFPRRRTSL